jgi:hypothetical protein
MPSGPHPTGRALSAAAALTDQQAIWVIHEQGARHSAGRRQVWPNDCRAVRLQRTGTDRARRRVRGNRGSAAKADQDVATGEEDEDLEFEFRSAGESTDTAGDGSDVCDDGARSAPRQSRSVKLRTAKGKRELLLESCSRQ